MRAIDVVEKALEVCDGPVYVRKEIIHNRYVVDELRGKGAHFVEEVHDVPDGAWLIYSAHGISPEVRENARRKRLRTIDATCPLVTKVHLEAIQYARQKYTIILIGHEDHDETIGTLGEAPESIRLVGTTEEAEAVEVPDPEPRRLPDADDALARRHARDRRDPEAPLSEARAPGQGRHLLRDAEPAGRGQGHGALRGPAARARRAQQLELAAALRGRARPGRSVAPDRARRRHPSRVARGRAGPRV